MKRFYSEVSVAEADSGWRVMLDQRGVKTPAGAAQVVPSRVLAELLADEWRAQGEKLDPKTLPMRDLADYAIDHAAREPAAIGEKLLQYAETDTLCYRADPDEPLYRRQQETWEPLLAAVEARLGLAFERTSGIARRPLCDETVQRLQEIVAEQDEFTLAAMEMLAALAASTAVALAAIEPDADAEALFAAANLEQDFQAEEWGWDSEAEKSRADKQRAFILAARFARAARASAA